MEKAILFNIQHFSLHDGPGIRTTVFFKGCNLRCRWCHNPESWKSVPEISFAAEKCIGCGKCAAVCKNGAHLFDAEGRHLFNRVACGSDAACTAVCNACALEVLGYYKTVDEVVREVLRDKRLYEISGGGITFSGGEPLLQTDFVRESAKRLKEQGIHVAVDTAAHVPWESFEACIPFVDLFLVDIKFFNERKHLQYTGISNRRIMENIEKLAKRRPIFIRIPLIADVNDSAEEMRSIADFLAGLGENIRQVELLTYHDLGVAKYAALGREPEKFAAPAKERVQDLALNFFHTRIPVLTA